MARMARAPAMRLALSDAADREAFDAALDTTPLGEFPRSPVVDDGGRRGNLPGFRGVQRAIRMSGKRRLPPSPVRT
jgi:hypothetical protein